LFEDIHHLTSFIDDLPVGIASADTTGLHANRYNKFFLKMFGWHPDEIDTMEKWFTRAYPDEAYRVKILDEWTQIAEEAQSDNSPYSRPMEAKVTCRDGSSKWCEVRYYFKEQFIYGIFTDITERKATEEKLETLSLCDPLTGIFNRRFFNINYYEKWHLARRNMVPLTIIIGDVDNFKQVNDTYGHLVGDKVLIAMANAISSTLKRSTDFVTRYGGEEFAIISYNSDENSALGLCKMIQHNLHNIVVEEVDQQFTMSFGINTIIPVTTQTPETFLSAADTAMYKAKNNGKDTIVIAEKPSENSG
jgi:diguanylate cyclase (GGDEF)-like protein/PAS domain S-box-containing protein